MGKTFNAQPIWFYPEDLRRRPRATVKQSGMFCIGKELRTKLPDKIRIGLLEKQGIILIKEDPTGYSIRKNGSCIMTRFAGSIAGLDIPLPARFFFEWSDKSLCWEGHVSFQQYGPDALIKQYDWLIEQSVATYAKTTPREDRWQTACEALLEAAQKYHAANGSPSDYFAKYIKRSLCTKNKHYTAIVSAERHSMDAPISQREAPSLTRHATIAGPASPIEDLTAQLTVDSFVDHCLSETEAQILTMLMLGDACEEIAQQLHVSPQEIDAFRKQIGDKWLGYQCG